MKLIHTADLHLDARMRTHFGPEKAKERQSELLRTFERLVDTAAAEGCAGILIAGDLFDTRHISATVRTQVEKAIRDHADIAFYYLRGNHDSDNFLTELSAVPENLHLFGEEWTAYELGRVVIAGREPGGKNGGLGEGLSLPPDMINIVMLHGQESRAAAGDRAEVIDLRELRHRHIDYLALGHVHAYKRETLDSRGVYCYPGCLEGRGFDECGPKGYVLLDIDPESGKITDRFVPFASRTLHTVEADAEGCADTAAIAARVEETLDRAGIPAGDLVKLVLTGALDVECEKDTAYLEARFRDRFYFLKLEDKTTLRVEASEYEWDESLKGEFVRQVMADPSLSEEKKAEIIRVGLRALTGKEAVL